jgi:diketogulonate reductase-like aldo/keto reductase
MRNVVEYCVNVGSKAFDKAWVYSSHHGTGVEDVTREVEQTSVNNARTVWNDNTRLTHNESDDLLSKSQKRKTR